MYQAAIFLLIQNNFYDYMLLITYYYLIYLCDDYYLHRPGIRSCLISFALVSLYDNANKQLVRISKINNSIIRKSGIPRI